MTTTPYYSPVRIRNAAEIMAEVLRHRLEQTQETLADLESQLFMHETCGADEYRYPSVFLPEQHQEKS